MIELEKREVDLEIYNEVLAAAGQTAADFDSASAFAKFDRDGDGTVTPGELLAARQQAPSFVRLSPVS